MEKQVVNEHFLVCEQAYREACEKYRPAADDPQPDPATVRRRWQIFVAVSGKTSILPICSTCSTASST